MQGFWKDLLSEAKKDSFSQYIFLLAGVFLLSVLAPVVGTVLYGSFFRLSVPHLLLFTIFILFICLRILATSRPS